MRFIIRGTNELPTAFDGYECQVIRRHSRYPEFILVLVDRTGHTEYFHESQLIRYN